jgi:hypothetical protein
MEDHPAQKTVCTAGESVVPEPIPQRPVGYFAVEETPVEYERANRLAGLSPEIPE